jgi:thiamine-phosphate pyrophosphorylase
MPGRTWPRLMVVSDRRRLLAVRGAPEAAWPGLLQAQVVGAVAGGADLVQIREPDLPAATLASFLRQLFDAEPQVRARVVVNDRADVALAVGAAGVHLPERSLHPGDVRRLAPTDIWVVGRSIHSAARAAGQSQASYLLAGTVGDSASKPADWSRLGWDGLRQVVVAAAGVPVVAIGGLSGEHAGAVLSAGAQGLAAIGAFLPASSGDVTKSVQERVSAARLAFDSAGTVPYTRRTGR